MIENLAGQVRTYMKIIHMSAMLHFNTVFKHMSDFTVYGDTLSRLMGQSTKVLMSCFEDAAPHAENMHL